MLKVKEFDPQPKELELDFYKSSWIGDLITYFRLDIIFFKIYSQISTLSLKKCGKYLI